MKTKFFALMILAASSVFAQTRFSIGVNIGGGYRPGYYAPAPVYAPAPAYVVDTPPCPGPGYTWVGGYWDGDGYGRTFIQGYWRAPYASYGYVAAPRYYSSPRYVAPRYDRYDRGRSYDRGYNRGYDRGYDRRGRR